MYLSTTQVAQSFGVSEKVIQDWVRHEGLPCVPDRGRLCFDRLQVVSWAAARGLGAQAGLLAPARPAFAREWRLAPLLRAGGIWRDVAAADVLDVLARVVAALPGVTPPVGALLRQRLREPEGVTWAPVGGGFALPHLRSHVALGRDSGTLAVILLRDALPLAPPAPDGIPVRALLFFLAPSPRAHLELLGNLSLALRQGPLRERILRGAPDSEILAAFEEADANAPSAASPAAPREGLA